MIEIRGPLTPGKCSGCGAPILWGYTKKDRPMILDPQLSPHGNCVVDGVVYMPHWASCNRADDFRKVGK